jgi:ketosteroid isomerase-like protein
MSDHDLAARLTAMEDQLAIRDVLLRYASTIDVKDFVALRATMTDGFRGKYGAADWIEGADAVLAWIKAATADKTWQHHLLSVYHVVVDGDAARALTYHTSYQSVPDQPGAASQIVARYHDVLARTADGWKLSEKVMEIVFRDKRPGIA